MDYLLDAGNTVVDNHSDPFAVHVELDAKHAHISVIFHTQILQQDLHHTNCVSTQSVFHATA